MIVAGVWFQFDLTTPGNPRAYGRRRWGEARTKHDSVRIYLPVWFFIHPSHARADNVFSTGPSHAIIYRTRLVARLCLPLPAISLLGVGTPQVAMKY